MTGLAVVRPARCGLEVASIHNESNATMPHARTLLAFLVSIVLAAPSFGDDSTETPRSALATFLQTVEASQGARRTGPCAPRNTRLGQLPKFTSLECDPVVPSEEPEESARPTPPSPSDTIRQVYAVRQWESDATDPTAAIPVDDERPQREFAPPLDLDFDSTYDSDSDSDSDSDATVLEIGTSRDNTTMTGAGEPVRQMDLRGAFEPAGLPKSQYQPSSPASDYRDPYAGASTRITKHWTADKLAHRTLYFEDVRLERHGQSHRDVVQSHLSFMRFMGDVVVTPFRLLGVPPHKCFYVQCEGRPGAPRE